jgi:hypothetical protein
MVNLIIPIGLTVPMSVESPFIRTFMPLEVCRYRQSTRNDHLNSLQELKRDFMQFTCGITGQE